MPRRDPGGATDRQRIVKLRRDASIALFKAQGALVNDGQDPAAALAWTARAMLALAEADSLTAAIDIARRVDQIPREPDAGSEGD